MDRPHRPPDQPGRPPPRAPDDLRARLDRLPPNHPSSPRYNPGTPARPRDRPRPADEQPERLRPWYAPHAAREQHIEHQRREQAPDTSPQRWRDHWYRSRHDDVPAPFRPEVAQRVPTSSDRTMGRLDAHVGGDGLPLESGARTGLTDALRQRLGQLPAGFSNLNKTHVEAHAAAWLRLNPHVTEATLYLNREPCPWPRGCEKNLPAMLPEGRRLTIYAPDNLWRVYQGQPDPKENP